MASTTTTAKTDTKRSGKARHSPSADVVMTRLREHLDFLQLGHTQRQLDELLAWARREQPSPIELLEHVLGAEVATKRDTRIERRITSSGLKERKLLEAFDFDFQPSLDRGTVAEPPGSTSSSAPRTSSSTATPALARATSSRPSGCVPASAGSHSATPAASI
ncbi:MAG: ATP-binding protein [Polyangiaceae bacterium]